MIEADVTYGAVFINSIAVPTAAVGGREDDAIFVVFFTVVIETNITDSIFLTAVFDLSYTLCEPGPRLSRSPSLVAFALFTARASSGVFSCL